MELRVLPVLKSYWTDHLLLLYFFDEALAPVYDLLVQLAETRMEW